MPSTSCPSSGSAQTDRACQFMPFAALSGYYELVQERNRRACPRHELTEEEAEMLSRKMSCVHKGMMIEVEFYDRDAYVTRQGLVSNIDFAGRILRLVKEEIPFDCIRNIRAEGISEEDR